MKNALRWVALCFTLAMGLPALAEGVVASGEKSSAHHHTSGGHMAHNHRMWRGERGGHKGMSRLIARLELTPEQQEQLNAVEKTARETSSPLRMRLKESRHAEHEALKAGADAGELRALARSSADIRVDLMLRRRQVEEEMLAILTPQQKVQLEEMKAQHKSKRDERMKKWRERRSEEVADQTP